MSESLLNPLGRVGCPHAAVDATGHQLEDVATWTCSTRGSNRGAQAPPFSTLARRLFVIRLEAL